MHNPVKAGGKDKSICKEVFSSDDRVTMELEPNVSETVFVSFIRDLCDEGGGYTYVLCKKMHLDVGCSC
jgi:hypothetical protein